MIHGDLHPMNCLVDMSLVGTDVQAHAVVVDLGSCKDQTACEAPLLLLLATRTACNQLAWVSMQLDVTSCVQVLLPCVNLQTAFGMVSMRST